jgi:telomerase Cajal body protein 1
MRGIVSCLSLQPDSPDSAIGSSMLCAGSWTRWVSLYDAEGLGGTVANWSISSAADSEAQIGGAGVSQVLWSSCGRYLFVAERKSQGLLVYDVRVTGRLVGWLEGREAETNQRMSVDIASVGGKSEVWAGGTDGKVRAWKDVGSKTGGMKPDVEWLAHEAGTTVGGTALHSCCSVLATASGMRREKIFAPDTESNSESVSDDESSEDSDDNHELSNSFSESSTSCSSHDELTEDNYIKIWSLI